MNSFGSWQTFNEFTTDVFTFSTRKICQLIKRKQQRKYLLWQTKYWNLFGKFWLLIYWVCLCIHGSVWLWYYTKAHKINITVSHACVEDGMKRNKQQQQNPPHLYSFDQIIKSPGCLLKVFKVKIDCNQHFCAVTCYFFVVRVV